MASNAQKAPPPPNPEILKAQIAAKTADHQMQMDQEKLKIDTQERVARFQLDRQKMAQESDKGRSETALAIAAHNKQMIGDAYALADKTQADQMRDPTALENVAAQIGSQFQQLATMIAQGQQDIQAGQQQLAEVLRLLVGESRQANQQEVQALGALANGYRELMATIQAPKRIVRDSDGRAVGVETARTLN
jgi:hypothetical protein